MRQGVAMVAPCSASHWIPLRLKIPNPLRSADLCLKRDMMGDTADAPTPRLSSACSTSLSRPSPLALHLTTNHRGSALFFMSPVFINRPGRSRLAFFKITSCQYSISEEEGNSFMTRDDCCVWENSIIKIS